MAHQRPRFWLLSVSLVVAAALLRNLLLTVPVDAAFSEASQLQASGWLSKLSSAAHSARPGGWIVPRPQHDTAPHTHNFQTVAVPLPNSFELIFPQVGNGQVASTGAGFQTMLTAVNFSNQPAHCRLSFFADDGLPLAVPVNDSSVASLEFELARGQQREFVTSGEGEVLVGWALLESDQPVAGQAVFGLRDRSGALVTEVGVSPADPGFDLTVLGDSLGASQTGIALANPGPAPLRVSADLLDAEGGMIASVEIDLESHGHLAVFLNELFEGIAGIEEFLGSIRLRSTVETPFAVMTLRSTGNLLTSLPTITPPPSESDLTRLAFPHVADGMQAPLSITTALVLFNTTDQPGSVTLDFFRSDANPMTVEIDGASASSFDFELAPRGVLNVETLGEGELQVGWARASMDQPLSGAAIFRVFRSAGAAAQGTRGAGGSSRALETEVGVPDSLLYRDFRILADTRGSLNTGLAVANVDADNSNASASLTIDLRSAEGEFVSRTQMEVPAGGQRALFLDQLFPDLEFNGFTGFLSVRKTVGPNIAAVALRSAGAKLTSLQALAPTNGFAPLIEAAPLQNLAGTRPGFRWMLHQNQDDLALRELTIRLPGMSLSDVGLDTDDEIGSGFFTGASQSRIFTLVVTETAPDSLMFNTVVPDSDGAFPGGSGLIRQTVDGLEIHWSLTEPEPFSKTVADIDHHFFLFPNILESPQQPGMVEFETELVSVSSSPTAQRSAHRQVIQMVGFEAPSASTASLEMVTPLFVLPDAPVQFAGSNLGTGPTVTFPLQNGETASVPAYRNANGIWEVQTPTGLAEGLIFVDNGNGSGNGYRIITLFSPVVSSFWVPGGEVANELVINVGQPAQQLALSRFVGILSNTDLGFDELTESQSLGTGTVRDNPFTTIELELRLGSLGENEARIEVRQVDQGGSQIAELILTRILDFDQPAIQFQYRPVADSLDTVITPQFSPLELELRLAGLPLRLPSARLVPARFWLFSAPALTGLAESALRVTQSRPLLKSEEGQ